MKEELFLVISNIDENIDELEGLISTVNVLSKKLGLSSKLIIKEDDNLNNWVMDKDLDLIIIQNAEDINQYRDAILEVLEEINPKYVIGNSSKEMNLVLAYIAGKLSCGMISDVQEYKVKDNNLVFKKPTYSEGMYCDNIFNNSKIGFITNKSSNNKKIKIGTPIINYIRYNKIKSDYKNSLVKVLRTTDYKVETPRLELAERIICVGNGVNSEEQIELINIFAKSINASVGCTRPVVEKGLMDKSLQIGQTGVNIKPKLYIGIGVSGALQHMVACNVTETIMAVNSDKNSKIFDYADFGLVMEIDQFLNEMMQYISSSY